MRNTNLDPLLVRQIEATEEALHLHSKAELTLVYIQQGKGMTRFDGQEIPFEKGKLFLIPFGISYHFQSEKTSCLLIIECPQRFITQIRMESDRIETCDNLYKLTYITHNYQAKSGCVFRVKEDEVFAEQLLQAIAREYAALTPDYLLIRQSIAIVLNLVARNLIHSDYQQLEENKKEQDVMKLITYVQQHSTDRKQLTIEALSAEFGIAKSYIGEYFKKQVGVSLQEYILDYKLKLVEIRLKYSAMRLKEIAFELDFNDESHLSKLFKKYKGLTPSQYRTLHRE
ncbi:AraC family transcriptional regulator [Myroides odoratus]|uniref:AraC family transcriptional regulator n=1 Tax=Myroides odoratus TaxID=256 RepID=UPI0039AF6389